MISVLAKISVYLVIIALGYTLKRLSLFKKEDAVMLGVLIVNVTLPAALLHSRPVIRFDSVFLILASIGLITNLFMLGVGYCLHPGKSPKTSAVMLSTASYNLGSFILPFIVLFFPEYVGYMAQFDVGNAIMGLGMNYVIARFFSSDHEKLSFNSVFRSLLRSVPLMTYILIILLDICDLGIPVYFSEIISVIAGANSFLCMFMVGLLIEFSLPRSEFMEIGKVWAARTGINLVFAAAVMILPLPFYARLITAMCLCSPVATASVVYSQQCGYRGDLVGMVSTFSILSSLAVIIAILILTAV